MANYDYVVVGAGSAGCALAARLSEDQNVKVLLIEAGGWDNNPLVRAPGGLMPIMLRGLYAWRYMTAPQARLNGRQLYSPRGKILGGGSSINGMVYDRGGPSDYDSWAALGNAGWSFAEVLPYFKRAETYMPARNDWHGDNGPIRVTRPGVRHALAKAFVEGGRQLGYPYNDDTNGPGRIGFGPVDMTVFRGRRWSSSTAYLRPAMMRKNLTILTNAMVTRILMEGTRAVGVEYATAKRVRQARAEREVIVSAGAIASPQLLMLSGIGDGDDLARHGIRASVDLKGVGRNLRDHLAGAVRCTTKVPVSLYNYMSPWAAAGALAQYGLFRSGPLATAGMETTAFVRSTTHPDAEIKFHFSMMLYRNNGREFVKGHGFFAHINCVRPESAGSVTLASANPADQPVIDPNFHAERKDLEVLRDGIRIARDLFRQPAFIPYRGEEVDPGPAVDSDDAIDAYIAAKAEMDYHSVGTCKMGIDEMAVVDPQLKVRGVEGLRVADASVMPRMVGGNTNMPVIMVAEKAADLILARAPPPPLELRAGEAG